MVNQSLNDNRTPKVERDCNTCRYHHQAHPLSYQRFTPDGVRVPGNVPVFFKVKIVNCPECLYNGLSQWESMNA